jgi:hypothetical protein
MGFESQDHEKAQPIASPNRDPLRGSRQVSFVVGRDEKPLPSNHLERVFPGAIS